MAEMLKQEERAIQERYEELGRRNSAVGTQPHPVVGTRKYTECTEAPQNYFPSIVICLYVDQSY